jgi:Predicted permeases
MKSLVNSVVFYFQRRNANSLESKRFLSKTVFLYILSEMFFAFLICFGFFFFIFFVNQILLMAKEILTKRVPFDQVALLILFSLPTVIAMSAPFACLVGTLMTVGRLTSDNEILVMLSSGLSYKNIFFPAITVGIIISLLSFFTNDVLLPAGTVQFNKLWRKILVSTPALEMEANSVKRFKGTVIVTGGVKDNLIENLLIMDRTENGERRIIMANSADEFAPHNLAEFRFLCLWGFLPSQGAARKRQCQERRVNPYRPPLHFRTAEGTHGGHF